MQDIYMFSLYDEVYETQQTKLWTHCQMVVLHSQPIAVGHKR
jgi:hypothetical protein